MDRFYLLLCDTVWSFICRENKKKKPKHRESSTSLNFPLKMFSCRDTRNLKNKI